jgi:adenosylcobinamide-GDP ribazoletransferase
VQTLYKNRLVLDIMAGMMFFTRIPIKWPYFSDEPPDLTRAAWAFPLVGLIVGFLSGAIGDICIAIGLPLFLSCVLSIALSIVMTGAFHEDGLADMADGFGAGGSPKRVNEIMHDSTLGTYGVAALNLGILIRLGVVICLAELGYSLIEILSIGFASGKLAILFTRNLIAPSDFAKMGSVIDFIPSKTLLSAIGIWLLPTLGTFPFISIATGAIFSAGLIFLIRNRSNYHIGGVTGDILGATAFLSELIFLLGIAVTMVSVD